MKYNSLMIKARILLLLGVWITVLSYLGFPSSWKDVLFTLSGLILVYFSYLLYKNSKMQKEQKGTFDNFKENHSFDEKEPEISAARTPEDINLSQGENKINGKIF